jgi:hypothetical protein
VCRFDVGTLAAGASRSLIFAVRVDSELPANVTQVVNQLVVSDDSIEPPGQSIPPVVTPIRPPTALDETEEPTLDERIFVPLIQR